MGWLSSAGRFFCFTCSQLDHSCDCFQLGAGLGCLDIPPQALLLSEVSPPLGILQMHSQLRQCILDIQLGSWVSEERNANTNGSHVVKLRLTAGGETENTNAGAGVHLSHCVSSTHWLTCLPFLSLWIWTSPKAYCCKSQDTFNRHKKNLTQRN